MRFKLLKLRKTGKVTIEHRSRVTRIVSSLIALSVVIPVSFIVIGLIFGLLSSSFVLHREVLSAQVTVASLLRVQADEEASVHDFEIYHTPPSLASFHQKSRDFSVLAVTLERQLILVHLDSSVLIVRDLLRDNNSYILRYALLSPTNFNTVPIQNEYFALADVRLVRLNLRKLSMSLSQQALRSDTDTVRRFTDVVTLCIYFLGITILSVLLLAKRQNHLEIDLRRERRTVDAFQLAALPQALPDVPGLLFDSVYVPARAEFRIGGDWYDAQRLADGRIVISIGDVAGFGLEASVTMAAVRQSIRAAAEMNPEPLMILDAADRTLKAQQPDRIVTAIVCVYDPIDEILSYASAGHPPPMFRDVLGDVTELPGVGLPLGLRRKDDGDVLHQISFTPGSFVALYTDGLTEAGRDVIAGMAELKELVQNNLVVSSTIPAKVIYEIMLPHGTPDDVAVFTLYSRQDVRREIVRWDIDVAVQSESVNVRNEFISILRQSGVCDDDLFSSELIFGEMLGNVHRYAPGRVKIVLDKTFSTPVLHFLDNGPGFSLNTRLPSDDMSERGRGLFLVWSLAEEFTVTRRACGGSHARAVLQARPVRKSKITTISGG